MAREAMVLNYKWCTGCHSCEIACQRKNELPPGQYGIKLNQVGPWEYGDDQWVYAYFPVLTSQCNLCYDRKREDKLPACVHHCQANCLQIMNVEDAVRITTENPKMMMMTL